ncbi:MAG: DegT/DnrJ/EryC1/StrS family aminotransferase [Planctomycetaceae bacterium]|nr:DegT/DnrJ/EryC1/StrS family aminotransferase [Planctomycetaceae bacterium]
MIPRHRPEFSLYELLRCGLSAALRHADAGDPETLWAERLGVQHAVWVPSGRYAVCRAVEYSLPADASVYCPAFTCRVVHEAIHHSGRRLRLIDSAPDSPLMDERLLNHTDTDHAVVLSEVFGHRYKLPSIESPSNLPLVHSARLRVLDMAMCLPEPADMQRLRDNDVAVLSFGLGKPLYAGGGGMVLTNDAGMADHLRSCRRRDTRHANRLQNLKQFAVLLARTAAHDPTVYGLCRLMADRRTQKSDQSPVSGFTPEDPHSPAVTEKTAAEWHGEQTRLSVELAILLAARYDRHRQTRLELAKVYRQQLSDISALCVSAALRLPPEEESALSHFCVRVRPELRNNLRSALLHAGVDTATLFSVSPFVSPTDCPNTVRLSQEIVGLPLSGNLTIADAERICRAVRSFAESISSARPRCRSQPPDDSSALK